VTGEMDMRQSHAAGNFLPAVFPAIAIPVKGKSPP